MRYAEISDGKIFRIIESDEALAGENIHEIDDEVRENWRYEGGKFKAPLPYQPTQLDIVKEFESKIQSHLDETARSKGYDNIMTACSYAGAPNPFENEAKAFITWRGEVWAYAFAELVKVQEGRRQVPDLEEFIAELPTF